MKRHAADLIQFPGNLSVVSSPSVSVFLIRNVPLFIKIFILFYKHTDSQVTPD